MASPLPRRHRLQICVSNQLARRPDLLRILAEEGCILETEECLDQCTRCESCAFALVDGHFLFSPTPDEFSRQLVGKDSFSPSGKR